MITLIIIITIIIKKYQNHNGKICNNDDNDNIVVDIDVDNNNSNINYKNNTNKK